MATRGANVKTSLGIMGTGAALLAGTVAVGMLICGGGFGGAVLERLPDVVFAPDPVMLPATQHRLPDVRPKPGVPVARNPDPAPSWPEPRTVFRDPPRWTEPGPEAMATDVPLVPLVPEPMPMVMEPGFPVPMPAVPVPMAVPVPVEAVGPMASVAVSGDAVSVVARSATTGQITRLPGALAPGNYELVVTFGGREPFAATSLLVLDASPRSVVCRASLGICKVR
ncbi:MAG: hypothetical protein KC656_14145 [Myxococcales bacterium]|nr:hypothetical protein [Myxococcales bacterium]